jgi:hypothetical protein
VDALRREDEGTMTCVAENAAKHGRIEKAIDLTVVIKPRIEELYNKTAPVEGRAKLVCRASGNPPPVVTFR